MRRFLLLPVGLVLALVTLAAPAWAGPGRSDGCVETTVCVSITSFGTNLAGRGDTVFFDYNVTPNNEITSAVFQTHQDPHLPASAASVRVNSNPLPPGAVTTTGGDLSIDLASVLPAGNNLEITFVATVDNTVDSDMTSWASVTFDDAAATGPATSNSDDVTTPLDRPNLALISSDTGGPVTVTRGKQALVDYLISNNNGFLELPATLSLTFPAGFALGSDGVTLGAGGAPLPCAAGGANTWTCQLAAAQVDGADLEVSVAAAEGDAPGALGPLNATITADGPTDSDPSDNTLPVDVIVGGIADLSIRLSTPADVTAAVGQPVTITATVTNAGPDPATDVFIRPQLGFSKVPTFEATGDFGTFGNNANPTDGTTGLTVPAGGSVTRTMTLTGRKAGTSDGVQIFTGSLTSFDPNVTCTGFGCDTYAMTTVHIPAATTTSTTTSTTTGSTTTGSTTTGNTTTGSTSAATDALANTGAPTLRLGLAGLALIVGGGVLSVAARRRGAAG